MSEDKKLNMPQSLLLLLLIIGAVAVCIRLKTGGPMIGLFMSWIIIYLFCKVLRINYEHVVNGAYDAIRVVVPTLCLLMAIGVMIGTWLQSGTIATIIVGGLKLINPTWLLPLTLIFCAVLSLVTGTSYGSVGSAGVAMMAIGNAMGIHPGMVAGAVICGAMFGDKLSPLSDTTNLAPAVAGSKLNDHVRSMLWTTLPTFVISLVLFVILGISQTSGNYETGNLLTYIDALLHHSAASHRNHYSAFMQSKLGCLPWSFRHLRRSCLFLLSGRNSAEYHPCCLQRIQYQH